MILARPSTIEKAIETATTAKPPSVKISDFTKAQWKVHQDRVINVLRQVKKQRAFLDVYSPGSFTS